jgi:hypothetical protein
MDVTEIRRRFREGFAEVESEMVGLRNLAAGGEDAMQNPSSLPSLSHRVLEGPVAGLVRSVDAVSDARSRAPRKSRPWTDALWRVRLYRAWQLHPRALRMHGAIRALRLWIVVRRCVLVLRWCVWQLGRVAKRVVWETDLLLFHTGDYLQGYWIRRLGPGEYEAGGPKINFVADEWGPRRAVSPEQRLGELRASGLLQDERLAGARRGATLRIGDFLFPVR